MPRDVHSLNYQPVRCVLEVSMFTHILIASDGSELAKKAVAQGLKLASQTNASVLAVAVTEPWTEISGSLPTPSVIEAYEQAETENAARITSAICESAKKKSVTCSPLHVWGKHSAEGIIDAAKKNNCDLIIMASHGRRGLRRFLLGSVAQEVLARSTIPVLICR
jgi:nucleotide-binding universal stress UspA family protein